MSKYGSVITGLVFLVICMGSVSAAEPAPAAAASLGGAPDDAGGEMILFQELPNVFGASKYEQRPSEAPSAVTIITAAEIQKYGYLTLAEVLRSVRGFYTTNDRNYSYVGVRGFARPGDYNTRVLLLLDGHRLNDNIYEQAPVGTESIIDVDMIERVEVIRGPSSSLYGTNAYLAVVNVITRTGRALKGGELSGQVGSFSTGVARAAYGRTLQNGGDMLLFGGYYDSKGQDLYFTEYDSPGTNNGRAEGADGDRYAQFFSRLSTGNFKISAGGSTRTKVIPTASYFTDFDVDDNQTTDARAFFDLSYDRELSTRTRLVGRFGYDTYRYDGEYVYSGVLLKDYGYGQWWTGELQAIHSVGDRHKVIYGAEARINTQQDQGAYDVNPAFDYFEDNRTSNIKAVYAQDEIRMGSKALLNVGVRHDSYSTFGGTTNPRLALIYMPTGKTTLKFLYGNAFRAPNAYELYYDDGGLTQKRNLDLEPEEISTQEVVFERSLGGSLRGVVSLYQYRISNLIGLTTDPSDGMNVFENIDRVNAKGIELELEGRFSSRLEGRISYALQDSEDVSTGDTLTNSPRHLAKLNLTTPLVAEYLNGSLEVQYLSTRDTPSGETAGSYTLTNLIFLTHGWKKGASLSLGIFNLLGEDYGDPGGEEHLQAVIPQDGRSYRMQFRYEF